MTDVSSPSLPETEQVTQKSRLLQAITAQLRAMQDVVLIDTPTFEACCDRARLILDLLGQEQGAPRRGRLIGPLMEPSGEEVLLDVWARHNPGLCYNEGTESAHYYTRSPRFTQALMLYLSEPRLQVQELDYIFFDMLLSETISRFGETMKERFLVPKGKGRIEKARALFKGRLNDMHRAHSVYRLKVAGIVLIGSFLAGMVIERIGHVYNSPDIYIIGALFTVIVPAVLLALAVVRNLWLWLYRKLRGRRYELWQSLDAFASLCRCWSLMTGPIVSLVKLRHAVDAAANAEVEWPQAALVLLGRLEKSTEGYITSPYAVEG